MSNKRDKNTGRFIKTGRKKLRCPGCGGHIGESSYYSGGKCRRCYFSSRSKNGRTPNTSCHYCGVPLYRPPNVLLKKDVFSCSGCKKIARREFVADHPEIYKKIVERAKKMKGTKLSPEKYICPDCGGSKSFSSKRCRQCANQAMSGENSHRWRGGITAQQRLERTKFSNTVRKQVLERDDYTCQLCGVRGGYLQVDHIQPWSDYVELRFSMDNCRTLCEDCHYKITFGREKPKHVSSWGLGLAQRGG